MRLIGFSELFGLMIILRLSSFQFGLIYFGAQKNVGPAGVVMVIVREDLLGHAAPETPMVFDYTLLAKNNSLLHTPPCYR